jgi:hypothetical protein
MKQQALVHRPLDTVSQRLAAPAMFLGSLFAIAMMLYALDTTPIRAVLQLP